MQRGPAWHRGHNDQNAYGGPTPWTAGACSTSTGTTSIQLGLQGPTGFSPDIRAPERLTLVHARTSGAERLRGINPDDHPDRRQTGPDGSGRSSATSSATMLLCPEIYNAEMALYRCARARGWRTLADDGRSADPGRHGSTEGACDRSMGPRRCGRPAAGYGDGTGTRQAASRSTRWRGPPSTRAGTAITQQVLRSMYGQFAPALSNASVRMQRSGDGRTRPVPSPTRRCRETAPRVKPRSLRPRDQPGRAGLRSGAGAASRRDFTPLSWKRSAFRPRRPRQRIACGGRDVDQGPGQASAGTSGSRRPVGARGC